MARKNKGIIRQAEGIRWFPYNDNCLFKKMYFKSTKKSCP